MSPPSKSTIRQRIRDKILEISGYRESKQPYEGFLRDPKNVSDKMFAIGIQGSSDNGGRQRQSEGVYVSSEVAVTVRYEVKPHQQVDSYDLAMDGEEAILQKLVNRSTPLHTGIELRYLSSNLVLTGQGESIILSINFQILHYIPLQ